MKKILLVGQTPPPWGGQSIMIEKILHMKFDAVKLYHIRMFFSNEFNEVGKFKFKKIFHIFYVIAKIYYFRFKYGIKILYYPPAGPNLVPVLRDIIILNSVRFLFRKTIFHFHAGGVSEYRNKRPGPFRLLFDLAYNNVDLSIRLSYLNPEDGNMLKTKKEVVIPYGIEDHLTRPLVRRKKTSNEITILFVGVVMKSKGVEDLIRAVGLLKDLNERIKLRIVGKVESPAYNKILTALVKEHNLEKTIEFCGVKTGDEKFQEYADADIFCFPTFFESETFGIVLLEAMCYKLPVVSTYWRGIPSVVRDGETGLLVPINNSKKLSSCIRNLIENEDKRIIMGELGRKRFLEFYTDENFTNNMNDAFTSV